MRAAMLERRIKKERRRKAEMAELKHKELRDASSKVTDLMAKALKNKIMFNMGVMGLKEPTNQVKNVD